jgi:hypothetical protein
MTTDTRCCGSPRAPGARRDHRLRERVDALGFGLVPLTLGKPRRIVAPRDILRTAREESAGYQRFALACAPAPSSTQLGRGAMPCFRGGSGARARPFEPSGARLKALAFNAGMMALAVAASLWLAPPAQAQETQIINPGSMAVTGFSGTVIPGFEEGLPPGVDPVDETSSIPSAQRCAFLTFRPSADRRPASSSTRRSPSRSWPARSARSSR